MGYLVAPEGDFQAITYSAGLKYNFNELSPNGDGKVYSDGLSLERWRFNLYNQTIAGAQRTNGTDGGINQISFGA